MQRIWCNALWSSHDAGVRFFKYFGSSRSCSYDVFISGGNQEGDRNCSWICRLGRWYRCELSSWRWAHRSRRSRATGETSIRRNRVAAHWSSSFTDKVRMRNAGNRWLWLVGFTCDQHEGHVQTFPGRGCFHGWLDGPKRIRHVQPHHHCKGSSYSKPFARRPSRLQNSGKQSFVRLSKLRG